MFKQDYKFSLIVGILCFFIGYMINAIIYINNKPNTRIIESTNVRVADTIANTDASTINIVDTINCDTVIAPIEHKDVIIPTTTVKNDNVLATNNKKKSSTKKVTKKQTPIIKSDTVDIIITDTTIVSIKAEEFYTDVAYTDTISNYDDYDLVNIPDSSGVIDTLNVIDEFIEPHQMTYEEEFIETIINEDTICGAYIFNDHTGYITKMTPTASKKCKIKNFKNERFVKRQVLDAKYDESSSYCELDSAMHIILCFDNKAKDDAMFKSVDNISNINIHRLTVKKNRREMHSDISCYGSGISVSNSAVSFDTKVIGENMVELVLPSNISSGEYAISYDSYQNQPNKKTSHNIFAFSI